jgi:hypothetical protein
MRYCAILIALLLLGSCGGTPDPRQNDWLPVQVGQRIFKLRLNPPTSLLDRPDLSAEIRAGAGWERVSLVSPEGNGELVDQLLDRMRRNPKVEQKVHAELTSNLADWSGNHRCRVLNLVSIDAADIQAVESAATPAVDTD